MTLSRVPLVAGLAVAQIGTASSVARAQGTFELRPSLSVSEVYESNLFSTAGRGGLAPGAAPRQEDVITRVSPGMESDFRTERWIASGRYTLDMERYATHHDLTSGGARQHATAALTYHATRRVRLTGGADFVTTRTPHELNVLSGLAFARTRGSRVSAHSTLTRDLNPVTSGTMEYIFSQDRLGRSFEAATHAAAVRAVRRTSPRTRISGWYRIERYGFATASSDPWTLTSQSLNAGLTHEITPRLTASLEAGPRVTEYTVRPELSASIVWATPQGDVSLAYQRTQTTVFGAVGPADVQSVRVSLARRIARALDVRLTPAVFTSALAGERAAVYAVAASVVRRLSSELALELSVDSSMQRGNLSRSAGVTTIPRHTALIRFVAAPARRGR
jgi:hypothetical protein